MREEGFRIYVKQKMDVFPFGADERVFLACAEFMLEINKLS